MSGCGFEGYLGHYFSQDFSTKVSEFLQRLNSEMFSEQVSVGRSVQLMYVNLSKNFLCPKNPGFNSILITGLENSWCL